VDFSALLTSKHDWPDWQPMANAYLP